MTQKNDEVPEDAKRDSLGVPYGTGDENGQQTYVREGDTPVDTNNDQSNTAQGAVPKENPLYTEGSEVGNPAPGTGYVENPDFVPDPTAMSGTLETSGTGGGANETTRGVTGVFEEAGLPSYRATDVVDGDATGQPAPHAGADAQVAAGPTATSYQESTIAGGAAPGMRDGEPQGAFTTARTPAEGSEDDQTSKETEEDGKDSQEPAEDSAKDSSAETKTPAKKTAAKKTTAARKTSTVEQSDDTKNA